MKKQIAIITGASSGLGSDYARELNHYIEVDEIWIIARREDLLLKLKSEIESQKCKIKILPLNLTDRTSFTVIKDLLDAQDFEVKILINNAGLGKFANIEEISLLDHQQMIDLNITALVSLTKICLPKMSAPGYIIQVSSIASLIPFPRFATYSATKTFVKYWSQALANEIKFGGSNKQISVLAVCPGPVATEFFEIASTYQKRVHKNFASPKDVVRKSYDDLLKNKNISIYGLPMNLFAIIYKWLPSAMINWILRLTNRT
ncbi:MAG: SDR family NAD(P)-dependent oxidoreductase [Bacteriovoracaceae bacterium]|nr:SDR family NAD(P)-dependent oxidoreductase [Bacteriovoracaceae bacterium]